MQDHTFDINQCNEHQLHPIKTQLKFYFIPITEMHQCGYHYD